MEVHPTRWLYQKRKDASSVNQSRWLTVTSSKRSFAQRPRCPVDNKTNGITNRAEFSWLTLVNKWMRYTLLRVVQGWSWRFQRLSLYGIGTVMHQTEVRCDGCCLLRIAYHYNFASGYRCLYRYMQLSNNSTPRSKETEGLKVGIWVRGNIHLFKSWLYKISKKS